MRARLARAIVLILLTQIVVTSNASAFTLNVEGEIPERDTAFDSRVDDPTPRSVFWMPVLSFFLPGAGQFSEGQYGYAAGYMGTTLAGLSIAAQNAPEEGSAGLESRGDRQRAYMLGNFLYQYAGGYSAYHTFRTAVRTQRQVSRFGFLTREESPARVALAPFDFRYATRLTTLLPLGILGALAAATPGVNLQNLSPQDVFYTGAYSWGAGTHEEAIFRGWLMPVMADAWGTPTGANLAQGVLFAALHMNNVSVPLPQLLLGTYLGWLTQRREWTIGESIFVHAWWDVIAIGASWATAPANGQARLAPIMLPPLRVAF
jgi:membrane protease YdiL (CAAX protease family)